VGRRLVRRRQGDGPDAAPEALGRLELSEARGADRGGTPRGLAVTRRALVGGALALGAPIALAGSGCGDADTEGTPAADAGLLNDALALELSAVALYEAGAELLDGAAAGTAERFAEIEAEHVAVLRRELEDLGEIPIEASSAEEYARDLRLDKLEGDDDYLNLAVDLENSAISVYTQAVAGLGSAELRRTALEIAAVDAAQISVLLGELGEPQVPDAFVVGAQAV
jgi:rubrerythrin